MIEQPSKDLTFIVFDNQKSAKFIKFNKKKFYTFFVTIPFVFFLTVFILINIIHFISKKPTMLAKKQSNEVLTLQNRNKEMALEMKKILKENEELLQKITAISTMSKVEQMQPAPIPVPDLTANQPSTLPLPQYVKTIPNSKNLTNNSFLKTKDMDVKLDARSISLVFSFINTHPQNEKISGYFIVTMQSKSGILFYPQNIFNKESGSAQFSQGESFMISRLRPVDANFSKITENIKDLTFKIYVFNRTGDLLLTESFQKP
ncbi:MAG: hypothetical protein U0T83_01725 [Bacteriovoracaceae bacterium]